MVSSLTLAKTNARDGTPNGIQPNGSGGRTRTDDPTIMSRVLLPTELRRL
jgi:hypothetical protein